MVCDNLVLQIFAKFEPYLTSYADKSKFNLPKLQHYCCYDICPEHKMIYNICQESITYKCKDNDIPIYQRIKKSFLLER